MRVTSHGEVTVRHCGCLPLIAAIRYPTHNHVFACLRPAPEDGDSLFAPAACRTRARARHTDLGRLRRPVDCADWRAKGRGHLPLRPCAFDYGGQYVRLRGGFELRTRARVV